MKVRCPLLCKQQWPHSFTLMFNTSLQIREYWSLRGQIGRFGEWKEKVWRAISWGGVMARDSGTGYGERFPGLGLWRGIPGQVMASDFLAWGYGEGFWDGLWRALPRRALHKVCCQPYLWRGICKQTSPDKKYLSKMDLLLMTGLWRALPRRALHRLPSPHLPSPLPFRAR